MERRNTHSGLLQHLQPVPVRRFDHDTRRSGLPTSKTCPSPSRTRPRERFRPCRFLKPDGTYDGHPASSALSLFEEFTRNTIKRIQANKQLWKSTAIIVTMDEGGGYHDSGYVQPIDFFGDGTRDPDHRRVPLDQPGHVDHTYTDHVSILKFIERN